MTKREIERRNKRQQRQLLRNQATIDRCVRDLDSIAYMLRAMLMSPINVTIMNSVVTARVLLATIKPPTQ